MQIEVPLANCSTSTTVPDDEAPGRDSSDGFGRIAEPRGDIRARRNRDRQARVSQDQHQCATNNPGISNSGCGFSWHWHPFQVNLGEYSDACLNGSLASLSPTPAATSVPCSTPVVARCKNHIAGPVGRKYPKRSQSGPSRGRRRGGRVRAEEGSPRARSRAAWEPEKTTRCRAACHGSNAWVQITSVARR